MNGRDDAASVFKAGSRRGWAGRVGGQAGLTLLELMISLGLGLVLLVGTSAIYVGSRQTYRLQEDNARVQESGRYVLELVGRGLRQAGLGAPLDASGVMPPHCGPASATCVAITGTDDSSNGTASDTVSVQFYANIDEQNPNPGTRDCANGFAPMGTLVVNSYALVGTDLTCTGSLGGQAVLLSNVEDFQVLYGIDNNPTDGSADSYSATPGNWGQVVTVRLCVLVRSANAGATPVAQRFMNCGGSLGVLAGAAAFSPYLDTRLRRAFVATFALRNRLP